MRRHTLLVICLIALVNGAFYIAYMRPDWDVAWSDQAGYKQLGSVLARTGKFTRYPDSPVFVPEVLRTPGYPAFVAVFYRLFGVGNDVAVTGAQAVVFALLCVLVFGLARRVGGTRVATVAALGTALFAPFAHFAALVLTELWTTFVATAAMLVVLRAVQKQRLRDFAVGGVLLSAHNARPSGVFSAAVFSRRRDAAPRAIAAFATRVARLGPSRRHRVADDVAVVHLQLRQPRAVHAVARRRHRPRPVGRLVARRLARPRAGSS